MNCLGLVKAFLERIEIEPSSYVTAYEKLVAQKLEDQSDLEENNGFKMICSILTDTYCLNAENVKKISDKISRRFCALGRYEKDMIKHYLDYNDENSKKGLQEALANSASFDEIEKIINEFTISYQGEAIDKFISNWEKSNELNDDGKKLDYLQGIYTRLVSQLNSNELSLNEIYNYNSKFIEEELDSKSKQILSLFCSDKKKINALDARKKFYDAYMDILDRNLLLMSESNALENEMNKSFAKDTPFFDLKTEAYDHVIYHITQKMYNQTLNQSSFMDLVLSTIQQSYRLLKNHKILALIIDNIFDSNGHNLKWLLYSYIGIYAEHFIPTKEKRKFYKPEQLAIDKIKHLGFSVNAEDVALFKNYYLGKFDHEAFNSRYPGVDSDDIFLDFENVWYGFTFSDCLSIRNDKHEQNSEISFIENTNELVMIFNKYRHDDRKIPCPDCAGLNISGNSFPEIGLRSWECKNIICPSRSKSNRGKRYSYRSNFMQRGFDDSKDIISKDLIRKWRRDIVDIQSENDIYQMLIQYFSFTGNNILVINDKYTGPSFGRKITEVSYNSKQLPNRSENLFTNYFNGKYVKRFINQSGSSIIEPDHEFSNNITKSKCSSLINGDSRSVLAKINENIFDAAVTSPPYYNARLYSQWPNLYLYLSDMYEIIKQTYRTLKPGAVYLYNIGDICGNENTIVNSTMGNKRILLGSYTIYLFILAGFELLDNVLWDKGEPQSNRQKNDGKFSPYYQKPMNVYEHMFLFKKPGAPCFLNSNNINGLNENWKTNISPFNPVIKINSKGENTLGHTAPFPLDIPDYVCKIFTTDVNDLILEPFAGSGTSIISASKNGRRCVGIELLKEYSDLILSICDSYKVKLNKIDE